MKTSLSLLTVALGLTGLSAQVRAFDAPASGHGGMTEIDDQDLANMRGRYTENPQTVAYFGVTMTSTWTTADGQQLQGSMAIDMDFTPSGQPSVTFTPTVNITHVDPTASGPATDATRRTVDSSGLNNISGLVQGVQVAGDANIAGNVTSLSVSNEDKDTSRSRHPDGVRFDGQLVQRGVQDGPASVHAQADGNGVQLAMRIQGQGAIQQWIGSGSLGQTIALSSDGAHVSNSLQIRLVQRTVAGNVNLAHDFAQSLNQVRSFGMAF